MAAGKDTFIDDILMLNGLSNAIKISRYPELTLPELASIKPDLVFLSSEPYPFKQKNTWKK